MLDCAHSFGQCRACRDVCVNPFEKVGARFTTFALLRSFVFPYILSFLYTPGRRRTFSLSKKSWVSKRLMARPVNGALCTDFEREEEAIGRREEGMKSGEEYRGIRKGRKKEKKKRGKINGKQNTERYRD